MTAEQRIAEILRDLELLCDFAYEKGFHEMGYDPVGAIGDFAKKATEELRIVEAEIGVPSEALLFLNER